MDKDFERLDFLEQELGVLIISYGTGPCLISGYCFEIVNEDKWDIGNQKHKDELDSLCYNAKAGYMEVKNV